MTDHPRNMTDHLKETSDYLKTFLVAACLCVVAGVSGQEIDHWESIIRTGDPCRYLVPSQPVDAQWIEAGFDDVLWMEGTGGVGFGDDDDNTVIDPCISVFCRYVFTVADPGVISQLVLDVDFDDGFVAYLNGTEVGRFNMGPAGSGVTWDQAADEWHEAELYSGGEPMRILLHETFLSALVAGENILAVQVHNQSLTSSDLSSNVFLHAGIGVETSYFQETPEWFSPPFRLDSTHLPLMVINTGGREIPDEPRITAHMGLVDNGPGKYNFPGDAFNGYDGQIAVELRGESSLDLYPKKSYRIETQTDSGTNNNVSLLGLPPENDYVLYAPYGDKSLIRNVISYGLYGKMGHYSPRTRFLELVVNGDYKGLYVLTELIKRDRNRVDIAGLTTNDTAYPGISGGYILRVDKRSGMEPYEYWESPVPPGVPGFNYIYYQYYDPGYEELTEAQRNYIRDYMQQFDEVFSSEDFKDPVYGYRPYLDIPSFVDMMILNEVTKDVDAYRLSHYFYKENDLNGGKLVNGPPWDYNLTFGNNDFAGDLNRPSNWVYTKFINIYWWTRAMEDPWFRNRLYCRWADLYAGVLSNKSIQGMIDSCITTMGPAVERNFRRWPILGTYIWPNSYVGDSYQDEEAYLRLWIRERITWMDSQWAGRCAPVSTNPGETIPLPPALRVYPNPSDFTRLYISVSGDLPREGMHLRLMDMNGKVVYHAMQELPGGGQPLQLPDLSSLPAGIYLLEVSDHTGMRKTAKVIRR